MTNRNEHRFVIKRSERLQSKDLSDNLTYIVPCNYLKAKYSVNWRNLEIAMINELDSLNKQKVQ